jgi:hypothetical protein
MAFTQRVVGGTDMKSGEARDECTKSPGSSKSQLGTVKGVTDGDLTIASQCLI